MVSVRELRDSILEIRKRNSPPLSTLNKSELVELLAKLRGGGGGGAAPEAPEAPAKPAEAPAKPAEAPVEAPKKKIKVKKMVDPEIMAEFSDQLKHLKCLITALNANESDKSATWISNITKRYEDECDDSPRSDIDVIIEAIHDKIDRGKYSDEILDDEDYIDILQKIYFIGTKLPKESQIIYKQDEIYPSYSPDVSSDDVEYIIGNYFVIPLDIDHDVTDIRDDEESENEDNEYIYDYVIHAKFNTDKKSIEDHIKHRKMRLIEEEEKSRIEKEKTRIEEEKSRIEGEKSRIAHKLRGANYHMERRNDELKRLEQSKLDIEEKIAIATINAHISSNSRDIYAMMVAK